MGSGYQQDVDQLQLFSDVSVYNNIINKPEQAEMVVDMACNLLFLKEELVILLCRLMFKKKY